ncbi:MAG TPA: HAD-IIIA family hydrolase [Tepidisphaeraceae bacterium]|nr:HAD-IIIA family hydrolase [Tepidisphaeraceae bacterium]
MKRPAVFFDRDNTLIVSDGYLGDPEKVVLVAGAADAVARARELGFAVVVFSNQSGVARGMFSEEDVQAVNQRTDELLKAENSGAVIDRHEFCPFHPDGTIDVYARESDRRKPKPGMILAAAKAMALDLDQSWVIGDAGRDIEAGKAVGCRTILFHDPSLKKSPAAEQPSSAEPDFVAATLAEAVDHIAAKMSEPRNAAEPTSAEVPVTESRAAPAEEPEPAAPSMRMAHSAEPAALDVVAPAITPAPIRDAVLTAARSTPVATPFPSNGSATPAASTPSAAKRVPKVAIGSKYVPPGGGGVGVTPARPSPAGGSDIDPPAREPVPVAARSPVAQKIAAREAEERPPEPPPIASDRVEGLLEQIFLELRRGHEQHEADFSVSKLLGGVVQILVLGILFLAYLKRGDQESLQTHLLLAATLQTMTVSLLIMSRQK